MVMLIKIILILVGYFAVLERAYALKHQKNKPSLWSYFIVIAHFFLVIIVFQES